jgi:hypothetical protein
VTDASRNQAGVLRNHLSRPLCQSQLHSFSSELVDANVFRSARSKASSSSSLMPDMSSLFVVCTDTGRRWDRLPPSRSGGRDSRARLPLPHRAATDCIAKNAPGTDGATAAIPDLVDDLRERRGIGADDVGYQDRSQFPRLAHGRSAEAAGFAGRSGLGPLGMVRFHAALGMTGRREREGIRAFRGLPDKIGRDRGPRLMTSLEGLGWPSDA